MDAIIDWYNDLMNNEIWFYLIHTLLKLGDLDGCFTLTAGIVLANGHVATSQLAA